MVPFSRYWQFRLHQLFTEMIWSSFCLWHIHSIFSFNLEIQTFCLPLFLDGCLGQIRWTLRIVTVFKAAIKMSNFLNIFETGWLQMRPTNFVSIHSLDVLDDSKDDVKLIHEILLSKRWAEIGVWVNYTSVISIIGSQNCVLFCCAGHQLQEVERISDINRMPDIMKCLHKGF